MGEINYIDAKRAQAIRKEVRRLLARGYSHEATVSALHALEVGDPFDDEAVWPQRLVDRLRNLPDTPKYVDALQELAACAYAENRVEFQRGKIERRGYKLSDAGAANLFVEKSREYKAESRYPEGLLEAIEFFVDAARGRIWRPATGFGFNSTGW